MPLADSWHIKSRAHRCSVTDRAFEEGEAFFTALFPDPETDGYLRFDFSQDAWDSREANEDQPFSFWRTIYKPPEVEAKVEIVAKDDPEALLSKMVEEDEEHTENARYILAVMLERKKILVETDSQKTNTGLLRIYQHRHSGEVFIVKDPQIPLTEIAPIQEEVQRLLSPDPIPEPEPQPESPADSGATAEAPADERNDPASESEPPAAEAPVPTTPEEA